MGNGAKAQQKRERNAKDAGAKGGSSNLKKDAAAQTIQCKRCFALFQQTSAPSKLKEHADTHAKIPWESCFPGLPKP